ncbi:TolC family protein [Rehaibacterium terrae]|uniref:Outer membrane protein TolC n=1 Tax=Rehaibacterium terrae TaxID=1341696 RepID=A0A7W8DD74_9GAMM|nr:TolC family protein [Rehaibacterium terrae]MBB5014971.1 outer membrane protein TolC [Rehaibacterium terrae]
MLATLFTPAVRGLLALCLLAMPWQAIRAQSPLPATGDALAGDLPALLAYADRHSPLLAGVGAETAAARARIDSAGALDDPMLRIELDDVVGGGLRLSPAQVRGTRYALMQGIPWHGKRALRRDIASADAERSEAGFRRTRSALHREIRIAHAGWVEALARLRVLDDIESILRDAEVVARTRYAAGLVPQGDVLRAQLALTGIAGERLELAARIDAAEARLNGLVGRHAGGALLAPDDAAPEALPALDMAARRLVERAPEIEAAAALERAASSRDALVRRERWPDLRVGLMAMQRSSRIDEWGLMLELDLPLRQARRRADEAESAAMRDAAHALREDAVARALAGLREAHAAASGARARAELFAGTLEVQAELTLAASLAAYRTGATNFLDVIDAALQLQRARNERFAADADYRRRLAELLDFLGEA